jgi:hypothetical protein
MFELENITQQEFPAMKHIKNKQRFRGLMKVYPEMPKNIAVTPVPMKQRMDLTNKKIPT